MRTEMIPVNEPLLNGREEEYVVDCLRSGWVSSSGPYLAAFEARWSQACDRRFGVAVSSGTAALDLAVSCLDLQPGDEIILPTLTIISCVQAVLNNGCTPVLIDSDPDTWCMDVSRIRDRITPRTRAIMPVHLYGHPVDMDPVLELARQHDLTVIEDAAEAHGAEYLTGHGHDGARWRRCGGMGHVSTFSFYANKLITTGEGGMLLTDDAALAKRARARRNLCFDAERRFQHSELGYNYRMTSLQAALGLAQIERFDEIVARKRWMGQAYTARLAGTPGVRVASEKAWARHVYWMYGLVIDPATGLDATALAHRLRQRGVDTRPFFLGMHEQPALRSRGLFAGETYPVAERLARQGLYLPSGLALTGVQIETVCAALRESLR